MGHKNKLEDLTTSIAKRILEKVMVIRDSLPKRKSAKKKPVKNEPVQEKPAKKSAKKSVKKTPRRGK